MGNGRNGIKRISSKNSGSYATPKMADEDLAKLAKRVYKHFTDKAVGTHEFDSKTGHLTENWFDKNSNMRDLINKLTTEQAEAFQAYAGGEFMDGQLYNGYDTLSSTEKLWVNSLDEVLDNSTVYRDITVVRLTDWQLLNGGRGKWNSLTPSELKNLEGSIIPCDGNLSTSAAAEGLTIGNSTKSVMLRIHIPGNSTGAGMYIGSNKINPGWGNEQREFLTNRNVYYKVGKSQETTISMPTYRGRTDKTVTVVDLYYVGRYKHDYGKTGKPYKRRR